MDPRRLITPFIFFCQRLRAVDEPVDLSGRPALRRLYGVWRQYVGSTTLARDGQEFTLRPGGVALSEPGMDAHLLVGGRLSLTAFALEPRIRQPRDNGAVTINDTQPPEASWRALFAQDLPVLVPEPAAGSGRELLDKIEMTYWRNTARRFEMSMRLAGWICGLAGENDRKRSDDLAQRYDDLVLLRYRDPVTVSGLASDLGVSTAYLTRHYRAHRSCAPGEALRRERLRQAQRLLASELSLAEIAARVGYRNTAAFIRAFRLAVGLPPERWRRKQTLG